MADHCRLKSVIALTRGNHAEAAFLKATREKLIPGLADAANNPILPPGGSGKLKSGQGTGSPPIPRPISPVSGPAGDGMARVKRLTANAAFIEHIKAGIALQLVGEYGERRSGGLLYKGKVRRFEISSPVIFQRPSGSGHDWRIPFTTRGKAVCQGGGMGFVIEGPVEGFAKIHFPIPVTQPDALPAGLVIMVAVEEAPV